MSLCLIDVHGDIEGDFEWVVDLPKNATNGEVLKALFPNDFKGDASVIKNADWWKIPYKRGANDVANVW